MCFGANLGCSWSAGQAASLVNEKVVLQPRQMPWHLRTRGPRPEAISGIRMQTPPRVQLLNLGP